MSAPSTSSANHLPTHVDEKSSHHHHAAMSDVDNRDLLEGGAPMGRQLSIQLTQEQFERLYLEPGGRKSKGDLSKRFANPTPLGIASFLLCLTPFSCFLMGWANTTTNAGPTLVGAMLFMGGIGLMVAAILEWVLGNTFTVVVFFTFGSFWLSFGYLLAPAQGIATAVGATTADYNGGIGLYLCWWSILNFIYMIASLRTNVVFVLLFSFLEVTFCLLTALYIKVALGRLSMIEGITTAAGAFGFLTCCMGWYLLVVLVFDSTGMPISLPVGDLSTFMARGARKDRAHQA
ncbi:uncharacterized protein JCM6883_002664 [Sporobolomyces salmoneus]|uniref:uncharacterized protein n=1 Tax=Sporobolomyces salmoneus TaxID=183962 RepID=UPI003181F7ED